MENESNKSYRIKTEVGPNITGVTIPVNITQQYDTFEILSLKIGAEETYRLHNANYGVVVGRVLANNGFGIPNAKLSIFIEADQDNDNSEILAIYGYTNTRETNSLGQTYNLLPNEQIGDCHQKIGAFPSKRYLLDNDTYIEVFDKYYKYTTRTNASGDYMICGVPVGNQTLHMDLDLSDCGILSQRPRDFVYKGYNIEQFENPNQFKTATGTGINSLSQYVQQTQQIYVNPLWGNTDLGETIGITRADVSVNFKFEPTCIFLGSAVSDSQSNGITKKCMPTNNMGVMDELTTGKGTIEMIRKTPSGDVEEFQIKGTDLIDGNGTWCYQIPMNLDYVTTDEYGNIVPTDDPERGIPTRARVRFRMSFSDFEGESNTDNYFRGKMLVPNNPQINSNNKIDYDYNFGTKTTDESYRDLLWNNVYTVKSYIPRWQKKINWKTEQFTGIKQCNFYGQNNPIPYNSIRIKMPFMFTIMCALIKSYIRIVAFINMMTRFICEMMFYLQKLQWPGSDGEKRTWNFLQSATYTVVSDGLCPDLENWYFAPIVGKKGNDDYCFTSETKNEKYSMSLCSQTLAACEDGSGFTDKTSIDTTNRVETSVGTSEAICLTKNTDYLISCIEMNLAQEYKVIKFDFYNDWINGLLYFPRWQYRPPVKRTFLWGGIKYTTKTKGCFDNPSIYGRTVKYTQQCSLGYGPVSVNGVTTYSKISSDTGCRSVSNNPKRQICHKGNGMQRIDIFGDNGGIIHAETTLKGQTVYYYKPTEIVNYKNAGKITKKVNLFATDLVLLGSLNDCSVYGIPQAFKEIPSSSYSMPTNLALTNMDEQGYLYTMDGGTYCTGKGLSDGVKRSSNNFATEILYASTQNPDDSIVATGDSVTKDINDYIPMTESAGISWNYAGPGQGENSADGLYTPGGHFLGISCVNSQTNIKTCLNLQRICEIGATMSERREQIRAYDKDGKEKYAYFVPTGFIGREEVINPSLRNMFSTLNMRPLIATKRDERTNYLIYDFLYMRSGGFDGSGTKITQNANYNRQVTDLSLTSSTNNFSIDYTSVYNKDKSKDMDEIEQLYRRSSEELNFGYYRFRFGIKDISDKEKANKLIESKYLINENGAMYLPQYENSYYFYFGLREGATAMDRFRSDFFSTCPIKEEEVHPRIELIPGDIDRCDLKWSVTVKILDMTAPYFINYQFVGENEMGRRSWNDSETFTSTTLSEFNVTVRDSEGVVISSSLMPATNVIDGVSTKMYDFITKEEGYTLTNSYTDAESTLKTNGGYINIDLNELRIFGEHVTAYTDSERYSFSELSAKIEYTDSGNTKPSSIIYNFNEKGNIGSGVVLSNNAIIKLDNGRILKIKVPKSKTAYKLYIGYKCGGNTTFVEIGEYYFYGSENFNVFYGSRMLMYDGTNIENFSGIKNNADLLTQLKSSSNGSYHKFRKITRQIEENGAPITSWLLRRAFIDTSNGRQMTDRHVFCTDMSGNVTNGLVVGQPENTETVYTEKDGWNETNLFSEVAKEYYQGYDISTKESIFPTWYMEDLSEVMDNWKNKNTEIVLEPNEGIMVSKDIVMNAKDNANMYTVLYGGNGIASSATKYDYLVQGCTYRFSCDSSEGTATDGYEILLYDFNVGEVGESYESSRQTLLLSESGNSAVINVPDKINNTTYNKTYSFVIYCGKSTQTQNKTLTLKNARLELIGKGDGNENDYIICPYKLNWHIGKLDNHEDILMGSYFFKEKTQYELSVSYHHAYKNLLDDVAFKMFFKYIDKNGNTTTNTGNCILFQNKSGTITITSEEDKTVCGVCCDAGTELIRIVITSFTIKEKDADKAKKAKYDVITYDDGLVLGEGKTKSIKAVTAQKK